MSELPPSVRMPRKLVRTQSQLHSDKLGDELRSLLEQARTLRIQAQKVAAEVDHVKRSVARWCGTHSDDYSELNYCSEAQRKELQELGEQVLRAVSTVKVDVASMRDEGQAASFVKAAAVLEAAERELVDARRRWDADAVSALLQRVEPLYNACDPEPRGVLDNRFQSHVLGSSLMDQKVLRYRVADLREDATLLLERIRANPPPPAAAGGSGGDSDGGGAASAAFSGDGSGASAESPGVVDSDSPSDHAAAARPPPPAPPAAPPAASSTASSAASAARHAPHRGRGHRHQHDPYHRNFTPTHADFPADVYPAFAGHRAPTRASGVAYPRRSAAGGVGGGGVGGARAPATHRGHPARGYGHPSRYEAWDAAPDPTRTAHLPHSSRRRSGGWLDEFW